MAVSKDRLVKTIERLGALGAGVGAQRSCCDVLSTLVPRRIGMMSCYAPRDTYSGRPAVRLPQKVWREVKW